MNVTSPFLLHKVTSFAATMGLILATVAGLPHSVSAANRNGLWVVVHDICLPSYQGIGVAFPCTEVNIADGLDRGFAVLQTPSSATHVIVVPTTRISGIESPGLLRENAPNEGKAQLVVTTETLLHDWLRTHKNWWKKEKNAPQKVEDALKSEPFYTHAISAGAVVLKYAEVPVKKLASAQVVVAILDARSQDMGPRTPDELIVSVVQDGKAFIATEPVKAKINPIPACGEIAKDADSKSDKAQADYAASGLKNEKLFDETTRLREQENRDFRKCFGERARREGFFPTVTQQAQPLIDRLTSR